MNPFARLSENCELLEIIPKLHKKSLNTRLNALDFLYGICDTLNEQDLQTLSPVLNELLLINENALHLKVNKIYERIFENFGKNVFEESKRYFIVNILQYENVFLAKFVGKKDLQRNFEFLVNFEYENRFVFYKFLKMVHKANIAELNVVVENIISEMVSLENYSKNYNENVPVQFDIEKNNQKMTKKNIEKIQNVKTDSKYKCSESNCIQSVINPAEFQNNNIPNKDIRQNSIDTNDSQDHKMKRVDFHKSNFVSENLEPGYIETKDTEQNNIKKTENSSLLFASVHIKEIAKKYIPRIEHPLDIDFLKWCMMKIKNIDIFPIIFSTKLNSFSNELVELCFEMFTNFFMTEIKDVLAENDTYKKNSNYEIHSKYIKDLDVNVKKHFDILIEVSSFLGLDLKYFFEQLEGFFKRDEIDRFLFPMILLYVSDKIKYFHFTQENEKIAYNKNKTRQNQSIIDYKEMKCGFKNIQAKSSTFVSVNIDDYTMPQHKICEIENSLSKLGISKETLNEKTLDILNKVQSKDSNDQETFSEIQKDLNHQRPFCGEISKNVHSYIQILTSEVFSYTIDNLRRFMVSTYIKSHNALDFKYFNYIVTTYNKYIDFDGFLVNSVSKFYRIFVYLESRNNYLANFINKQNTSCNFKDKQPNKSDLELNSKSNEMVSFSLLLQKPVNFCDFDIFNLRLITGYLESNRKLKEDAVNSFVERKTEILSSLNINLETLAVLCDFDKLSHFLFHNLKYLKTAEMIQIMKNWSPQQIIEICYKLGIKIICENNPSKTQNIVDQKIDEISYKHGIKIICENNPSKTQNIVDQKIEEKQNSTMKETRSLNLPFSEIFTKLEMTDLNECFDLSLEVLTREFFEMRLENMAEHQYIKFIDRFDIKTDDFMLSLKTDSFFVEALKNASLKFVEKNNRKILKRLREIQNTRILVDFLTSQKHIEDIYLCVLYTVFKNCGSEEYLQSLIQKTGFFTLERVEYFKNKSNNFGEVKYKHIAFFSENHHKNILESFCQTKEDSFENPMQVNPFQKTVNTEHLCNSQDLVNNGISLISIDIDESLNLINLFTAYLDDRFIFLLFVNHFVSFQRICDYVFSVFNKIQNYADFNDEFYKYCVASYSGSSRFYLRENEICFLEKILQLFYRIRKYKHQKEEKVNICDNKEERQNKITHGSVCVDNGPNSFTENGFYQNCVNPRNISNNLLCFLIITLEIVLSIDITAFDSIELTYKIKKSIMSSNKKICFNTIYRLLMKNILNVFDIQEYIEEEKLQEFQFIIDLKSNSFHFDKDHTIKKIDDLFNNHKSIKCSLKTISMNEETNHDILLNENAVDFENLRNKNQESGEITEFDTLITTMPIENYPNIYHLIKSNNDLEIETLNRITNLNNKIINNEILSYCERNDIIFCTQIICNGVLMNEIDPDCRFITLNFEKMSDLNEKSLSILNSFKLDYINRNSDILNAIFSDIGFSLGKNFGKIEIIEGMGHNNSIVEDKNLFYDFKTTKQNPDILSFSDSFAYKENTKHADFYFKNRLKFLENLLDKCAYQVKNDMINIYTLSINQEDICKNDLYNCMVSSIDNLEFTHFWQIFLKSVHLLRNINICLFLESCIDCDKFLHENSDIHLLKLFAFNFPNLFQYKVNQSIHNKKKLAEIKRKSLKKLTTGNKTQEDLAKIGENSLLKLTNGNKTQEDLAKIGENSLSKLTNGNKTQEKIHQISSSDTLYNSEILTFLKSTPHLEASNFFTVNSIYNPKTFNIHDLLLKEAKTKLYQIPLSLKKSSNGYYVKGSYKIEDTDFYIELEINENLKNCSFKTNLYQNEKFTMKINNLLTKSRKFVEIISLWKLNVDNKLIGNVECIICYMVVAHDKTLPDFQCKSCKNYIHKACLRKWIGKKQKAICPLDRQPL